MVKWRCIIDVIGGVEMALVRKNIRLSDEIAKWYENRAEELGISQSNLMTMALSQYIDQQRGLEMMSQFKEMVEQLDRLKEVQAKED